MLSSRTPFRFKYGTYGLVISSTHRIPGLVEDNHDCNIDVQIDLRNLDDSSPMTTWDIVRYESPSRDARGESVLKVWESSTLPLFRFLYSDGTEFLIDRPGSLIQVIWPKFLSLENAVTYLLGPIFGFVLRLHGVVCLHASAVALGDRAIALMGPSGGGKSTAAAAFSKLGYPALSDDVVALDENDERFWVRAGYPRLNLWPKSAQALYGMHHPLPHITPAEPQWDKRFLAIDTLSGTFRDRPLPLAAIYTGELLADNVQPVPVPLSAADSFLALVANTYTPYLLSPEMRKHEFEVLTRIASRVPVIRLRYYRTLDQLDELCKAIITDSADTARHDEIDHGAKPG